MPKDFTPEHKAEAVPYVISSGQPVAEVARALGIVETTLGNWVAKAREMVGRRSCNIDFRTELAYSGGELDPSTTYEIIYEVS